MASPDMQMHYTYRPSWRTQNAHWDCYKQEDGTYKVRFWADRVESTEWTAEDFTEVLAKVNVERLAWEREMDAIFAAMLQVTKA